MGTVANMPEISINSRDNTLRAYRFGGADAIPMRYHISHACWQNYEHAAL